ECAAAPARMAARGRARRAAGRRRAQRVGGRWALAADAAARHRRVRACRCSAASRDARAVCQTWLLRGRSRSRAGRGVEAALGRACGRAQALAGCAGGSRDRTPPVRTLGRRPLVVRARPSVRGQGRRRAAGPAAAGRAGKPYSRSRCPVQRCDRVVCVRRHACSRRGDGRARQLVARARKRCADHRRPQRSARTPGAFRTHGAAAAHATHATACARGPALHERLRAVVADAAADPIQHDAGRQRAGCSLAARTDM
ncbi:MAG: Cell division protein FtsQ, partial [uncultured Lysobacter sp.]